jgi:PncC family amidohydrolase
MPVPSDPTCERLLQAAGQLAGLLQQRAVRIVLAESCTAGLIAATLARFAGISEHLCGSAVVYRAATKRDWLGVAEADLDHPDIGPVSPQVARRMAVGALERTAEAALAAAITGHLGPHSPDGLDGVVYIGLARRTVPNGQAMTTDTRRHILQSPLQTAGPLHEIRLHRQQEAAAVLCEYLRELLESGP